MLNVLHLLFLVFFGINLLTAQDVPSSDNISQQVSVFDNELEFSGWHGNKENVENYNEIRIGLFLPEHPLNKNQTLINNGADLAVKEINASGGYHGLPYRLMRRWSNDPWKAASKEMIKLVYQDSVWAVIGSLDGNATHIAEQIATKAFIPLISPVSADPTLNYIRIPWMFRMTPDYKAQSDLIIKQCIEELSVQKIGLISTTSHDGRVFSKEIKDAIKAFRRSLIFHFEVSPQQTDLPNIIERALTFQPDGLIAFLPNHEIENLISELRDKSYTQPLFIPWIPGINKNMFAENNNGNIWFVEPFSLSQNPAWDIFKQKYQQHFAENPSAAALFTYDAVYLLTQAIEKAGLNRAAIRDAIADTDYFSSVMGEILWDNTGGSMIQPVLRKMVKKNN